MTWFSIILSLQHLYLVTGSWQWDSISSLVLPKSNVSLHNTLFLCILHNVWLGFLIFIFYIADMTTSIMLFSLPLILYAIFPLSLQNTVALHTFQRKEQLILQWSLEEMCLERFLHIFLFLFHPCTSWFLPLHLPIGSGLSFAPCVTFLIHFF